MRNLVIILLGFTILSSCKKFADEPKEITQENYPTLFKVIKIEQRENYVNIEFAVNISQLQHRDKLRGVSAKLYKNNDGFTYARSRMIYDVKQIFHEVPFYNLEPGSNYCLTLSLLNTSGDLSQEFYLDCFTYN